MNLLSIALGILLGIGIFVVRHRDQYSRHAWFTPLAALWLSLLTAILALRFSVKTEPVHSFSGFIPSTQLGSISDSTNWAWTNTTLTSTSPLNLFDPFKNATTNTQLLLELTNYRFSDYAFKLPPSLESHLASNSSPGYAGFQTMDQIDWGTEDHLYVLIQGGTNRIQFGLRKDGIVVWRRMPPKKP